MTVAAFQFWTSQSRAACTAPPPWQLKLVSSEDDTVDVLKERIKACEGTPASQQVLYFDNKPLDEGDRLLSTCPGAEAKQPSVFRALAACTRSRRCGMVCLHDTCEGDYNLPMLVLVLS